MPTTNDPKRPHIKIRPADCSGWLYAGLLVDPVTWQSVSAEIQQANIDRERHDPTGPLVRFEVEIEMLTDAEVASLPEFSGW
jgi:hypothetical protein